MADEPTTPKRKWLRRVRTVVLCLIAGAIINVLVAWGCVYLTGSSEAFEQMYAAHTSVPSWGVIHTEQFGITTMLIEPEWEGRAFASERGVYKQPPRWSLARRRPTSDEKEHLNAHIEQATGVPMRSMRCVMTSSYPNTTELKLTYGQFVSTVEHPYRAIPLMPIAPGFLVNTVTYGSLMMAVCALVAAIRRKRRHGEGLCPSCAYDLRGAKHEVCPECGK